MPDQILIKNLPEKIRVKAEQYANGKSPYLDSAFSWNSTEEGYMFWKYCDQHRFDKALEICPEFI